MKQYAVKQDYSVIAEWRGSVEDEMMTRIASDMAKEIDWNIMSDFCLKDGWTEVTLTHSDQVDQIEEWAKINCKRQYMNFRNRWLFKELSDATWFKLRWI